MKVIKINNSLTILKAHFMPVGVVFSIPPACMFMIIIYKSIISASLVGGWLILLPVLWGGVSIPFIGSRKVWSIDISRMEMEISHYLFNFRTSNKLLYLKDYKGLAWGRVLTQNAPYKSYSCFTLVHLTDLYRDVYGVGGIVGSEDVAEQCAKEYASYLGVDFLGRYDSKSLGSQGYGS